MRMRRDLFKALDIALDLKADLMQIKDKVSFTEYQGLVPKIQRNSSYLETIIQDLDLDLDPSLSREDAEWFEEIFLPVLRPWLKVIDHLCGSFIEDDYQPEVDSIGAEYIIQAFDVVIRAFSQALYRVGVKLETVNAITSSD